MSKTAVSAAHPFDEAIALVPMAATVHEHGRESTRHWQGRTHPAYANMVGPFGGVTAAQALQSVMQHPERLGEPRGRCGHAGSARARQHCGFEPAGPRGLVPAV